ncbi:sigma-70 family RNA polymerase sigma factor [Paenibacillus thermotolerans]|uniref:sigma-70 family RNA polymerase sigma factor n=1 Tax=Paenibacillus thermotolerans TaxID=3027807 RepID=UPI002368A812|nr:MULTISPECIES: sigma-70 family RNA polymerase sigma factor [unclassified Paenibacillus]
MERWVEDAKKGNSAAFEQLVKHYRGMAFAVAYHKLRDAYSAEDAVQESFMEAFVHLHRLRETNAFPGWFRTIVERQCYRMLRRKKHRTVSYDAVSHEPLEQDSVSEEIEKREMQRKLLDSVQSLPLHQRIAVQLFYFHGYSIKEISSFLGVSAPVLKKRLFDARYRLKHSLPVADLVSVFNDLKEEAASMLHIVNGDSVGDKLKQGGIEGDILVWREIYTVGPVFENMSEDAHRSERAAYLERAMGIPRDTFMEYCRSQEQVLGGFQKYREIVLWFEHDLYDQTMLAYLLNWFSGQKLGDTKLSLLTIGEFPGIPLFRGLGQLTPKQLMSLSGTWKAIGRRELELGRKAWTAYASERLSDHVRLLQEDLSALPFLKEAFEAHLSRLPSPANGLGAIEQATLESVAAGIVEPYELFRAVGDRLHLLGMGDLEYWHRMAIMSAEPGALLHIQGMEAFPSFTSPVPPFRNCNVDLTELGKRVLDGKERWSSAKRDEERLGGLQIKKCEGY